MVRKQPPCPIRHCLAGKYHGGDILVIGTFTIAALVFLVLAILISSMLLATGKRDTAIGVGLVLLIVALALFAMPLVISGNFTSLPDSDEARLFIDDNVGDAATVTFKCYDMEADNPFSAEIACPAGIYNADTGALLQSVNSYQTTADFTDTVVGQSLNLYGGNTSNYYVDNILGIDVTDTKMVVEVSGHTFAAESSMATIAYDSDGTVLDAAANATEANYNLTLGIGQEKVISVKLTNEDTDSLFKLYAVCTGFENESAIDDIYPIDSEWTEVLVPDGVSTSVVSYTGHVQTTTEEYDKCWVLDSPHELKEWKSVTHSFVVEADDTYDPVTDASHAWLMYFDGANGVSSDGKMEFDFYQHVSTGDDVGISETEASPANQYLSVVLNVI